jgi:hypothetical protein
MNTLPKVMNSAFVDLPKFDIKKSCAKCGQPGGSVNTRYQPYSEVADNWVAPTKLIVCRAHMQRTCSRCNYMWNEAPLDE